MEINLQLCKIIQQPIDYFFRKLMAFYGESLYSFGFFCQLIHTLLAKILGKIVQIIIIVLTLFSFMRSKKKLPPISNDLLYLSASKLAEKIRKREIKSSNVLEAYIVRIKDVNPVLNSVVQERFKEALDEARVVDNLLTNKPDQDFWAEYKPLLGVPFTVKESIAVRGMSNNAFCSRVQGRIAKTDAECVALLRSAGAIPLLVSNTPEMCLNWETYNDVIGTTNNPYDSRRTPGGSSGGEASLLGAGASVIGIGSDIAGSLRLPAYFCGVYGHKPTPCFVSNDGHKPNGHDPDWNRFFTLGPLCRYAEDLPILLKTLIPKRNKPDLLKLDEPVNLKNVKIYYSEGEKPIGGIFASEISQEIKQILNKSVAYMKETYGIKSEKIELSESMDSMALAGSIMFQMNNIETIFQKTDEDIDDWNSVTWMAIKKILCRSKASLFAITYGPLKALLSRIPEKNIKLLIDKKDRIKRNLLENLGDNGVLLYPTFPEPAPYHKRMFSKIFNATYMTLFNILELPVTQCPIEISRNGLPIGLQIVASPRNDRLCIAIAQALEKGFGGWKEPF